MSRDEIRTKWSELRDNWTRLGVSVAGAAVAGEILADLEMLWQSENEAQLDLAGAAALTGYSAEHLRRMVRQGRVKSHRIGRRLFFRTVDLPMRPRVDSSAAESYDPIADARQVAAQRTLGGTYGKQTAA